MSITNGYYNTMTNTPRIWEGGFDATMLINANYYLPEVAGGYHWELRQKQIIKDIKARISTIEDEAVRRRDAELRGAIDELETKVKPTHAEENGYGCALDDMRALLNNN